MCARTRAARLVPAPARAVCADAARLPFADDSLDLVWSNFTLQWCGAPDAVFVEGALRAAPGRLFLFTTLGRTMLRELRAAWRRSMTGRIVNDSPTCTMSAMCWCAPGSPIRCSMSNASR